MANHQFTVVGVDAAYTKPFNTTLVMLAPGQTTDVLVTANQPQGRYYIAAKPYAVAKNTPFDNTTATAIFEYQYAAATSPIFPQLPLFNDTNVVTEFSSQLRSLNSSNIKVPTLIDESLFFTVGFGTFFCPHPGPRCQGPNNTRITCSMNNISFIFPTKSSLLQAYYYNIPGIFTLDFPRVPPLEFDYTGKHVLSSLGQPIPGTKLYKLRFGSNVQIVLQDTSISGRDVHPIHLHGYHFYVIGEGFGNFNPEKDSLRFNLVDPPLRNTVDVPFGGWAVIRFVANNPGMIIIHYVCIYEIHMLFIVGFRR